MKKFIAIIVSVMCFVSAPSFSETVKTNPLASTKQIEEVVNSPFYNYAQSVSGDLAILTSIYKELSELKTQTVITTEMLDEINRRQLVAIDYQRLQIEQTKLTNKLLMDLINKPQGVA